MKKALLFLLLLAATILQGCTTLADAAKAQGQGVLVVYKAPYDEVWEAALSGLAHVKQLELVSENKLAGKILAQRGMGFFQMSYGENVAIFVKSMSQSESSVEVVSKKVMATNIFAPDWSADIHKEIAANLKK